MGTAARGSVGVGAGAGAGPGGVVEQGGHEQKGSLAAVTISQFNAMGKWINAKWQNKRATKARATSSTPPPPLFFCHIADNMAKSC